MAYVLLFAIAVVAAFIGGLVSSRVVLADIAKAELAAQAELEKYLAEVKKLV